MTNKEWLASQSYQELAILYCVRAIPWFTFFNLQQKEDIITRVARWLRSEHIPSHNTVKAYLVKATNEECALFYCKWAITGFEVFSKEQQQDIVQRIAKWLNSEHEEAQE